MFHKGKKKKQPQNMKAAWMENNCRWYPVGLNIWSTQVSDTHHSSSQKFLKAA